MGNPSTQNYLLYVMIANTECNQVQEVVGDVGNTVSTIVGNYQQNMTFTGDVETLSGGLTQKTYKYDSLGTLVNIIFNALGQVVQATVASSTSSSASASTTTATTATAGTTAPVSTTAVSTATAAARL